MKLILLLLVVALGHLNADEVQRIESIVKDINKLRSDYSKLDDELALYKYNLKDEKEKNDILNKEIDSLNSQLKKLNNSLKAKDNRNKNTKNNYSKNSTYKIKLDKCLENQRTRKENVFPTLVMKEQYRLNQETLYFKPSSFRLNKEADIYDAINGNKIDTWEDTRSFTSNQKTEEWIKITGYFVEKVWRPSQEEIWIKKSDATQRGD